MHVTGETEPGSVRRTLDYEIDGEVLDRFVEGFDDCRQFMRFECRGGTKLMTYGTERRPSTWYATRNGQHGLQWASAPPYSRMCPCALNSSCIHNNRLVGGPRTRRHVTAILRICNCDSGRDGIDEGYNTHTQLLPVMQLFVGGTAHKSTANVSIGPLRCARRRILC